MICQGWIIASKGLKNQALRERQSRETWLLLTNCKSAAFVENRSLALPTLTLLQQHLAVQPAHSTTMCFYLLQH